MPSVTLALLGDVMLGRLVNEQIKSRPPAAFWGNVLPVLTSADAVFANLECAITRHPRPWARTPKVFHFRADPAAIEVLRVANIRYVSLANNHVLDYEEQGLIDTLHHLDEVGIARAGAGATLDEAMRPALVDVAGLKIGVIALTDNEPGWAAGHDRPGVYHTDISTRRETLEPIRHAVADLRAAGANLAVLSPHWGPNMVVSPPTAFRRFGHAVTEAGIDLLHGHSAHLFQGIERLDRHCILYDTGDFLDDYAVDPVLRNDWSFVFLVEADAEGLKRLLMLPVRLQFCEVTLAEGNEFQAICKRMLNLCAALGTPLRQTDRGLELVIRGG